MSCQPHIENGDVVTASMFCASENWKAPCEVKIWCGAFLLQNNIILKLYFDKGDTGGPLAVVDGESNTLYGVVSWGNDSTVVSYPGVYTKVW